MRQGPSRHHGAAGRVAQLDGLPPAGRVARVRARVVGVAPRAVVADTHGPHARRHARVESRTGVELVNVKRCTMFLVLTLTTVVLSG